MLANRRTPLQPKNTPASNLQPKSEKPPLISAIYTDNKENINPASMDASLAEELNAVRKKMERLRLDRENTEKMLRERDRIFEIQIEELKSKGEFQKEFEIEVDRLYRLKQLRLQSMRMSPIRSLREREMQKRSRESPSQSRLSMTTKMSFSSECTSDVSSSIRVVDCSV